jgi:putative endonuclease
MQNFYLYILRNKVTDKFYIGSTENLEARLERHNSGYVKSTKSGSPNWEIVYTESFESRSLAQSREYEVKKKKSRKYIEYLIKPKV